MLAQWVYVARIEKAAIDRDADLLAPAEFKEHAAAAMSAVLEELRERVGYECFKRRPRAGARNAFDLPVARQIEVDQAQR